MGNSVRRGEGWFRSIGTDRSEQGYQGAVTYPTELICHDARCGVRI